MGGSNTADVITVGQMSVRFLIDAEDSAGSLTAFECLVPAQARVPLAHSHDAFDETVFGLEGTLTYTVDGERFEGRLGECDLYPAGCGPPLREPGNRGRQGAGHSNPRDLWPLLFPRDGGGSRGPGRRTTRAGRDGSR